MSAELVTREAVLAELSRHVGVAAGIHVRELAVAVAGVFAGPAAERQVRSVVEALRREGHHVCAEPAAGYYIAADAAELDRTCQFLYERAMTSLVQVAAMRRVSLPDLAGQLRLRT